MDELVATCQRLARVPSAVPLGPDTLIDPDDPLLVAYVQEVIRPEFERRGVERLIDVDRNQLLAEFGDGDGPAVLVMAYTPTQHNNLMAAPWSGRVAVPRDRGVDEPCIFGQGVSQNKVHQAVLLETAARAVEQPLRGTLWLAVNNEGRSTHDCTTAILAALGRRPDFAVLLFPTDLRISVGNRGRVDIVVDVDGAACHSSQPRSGRNAIDGAAAVVARVQELDRRLRGPEGLATDDGAHAVVYQVTYDPVAPHTLPGHARLIVDRRLRAGDDADEAVAEVSEALGDLHPFSVSVRRSVTMEPADVDLDALGGASAAAWAALEQAVIAHLGVAERYRYPGTFDSGGLTRMGIPAVMFGAAGAGDLLGDDFVALSALRTEARIIADFIDDLLLPATPRREDAAMVESASPPRPKAPC